MSQTRPSNTSGVPERLTLSSPDALLAAVPHLLGFPPRDSVVLVGLEVDPTGRESIRLTQRFDLPPADLRGEDVRALAQAATAPMVASGSSTVIVTVFGDGEPGATGLTATTELVDRLVEALDDEGVWIKDALYTDGVSRWSYGCENPSCCPREGMPISDELRTMIAAEFTGVGAAMSPSRQAVIDEVAGDPARISQLEPLLDGASAPNGELETWRDESIDQILDTRQVAAPSDEQTARILAGLRDVRVRDTVLWELAHDTSGQDAVISAMTTALRGAPTGHVAPVATCLAIQHWTRGDGVRANACLDRAIEDDPDYSLAGMVSTAVGRGLPPSSWTDVMRQLDRDACRMGPAPEATAPEATTPAPAIARRSTAPSLAS